MLHYADLTASPDIQRRINHLAYSDWMDRLLKQEVLPDPDKVDDPAYLRPSFKDAVSDLDVARRSIAALVIAMIDNACVILSDIDGTSSPLHRVPSAARTAPGFANAMARLENHKDGSRAFCITGRSEKDVHAMLLTDGRTDLPVMVICSHGTVLVGPGELREELNFTDNQHRFISDSHKLATRLQTQFSGVGIQLKHSGIDIKDEAQRYKIEDILAVLSEFCTREQSNWPEEERGFEVAKEGDHEVSIRFNDADKQKAIEHFVFPHTGQNNLLFLFAGDSLGEEGTDRKAGQYIQSKGGVAVQILNGREQDMQGFIPDVILANPYVWTEILDYVAAAKDLKVALATAPRAAARRDTQGPRQENI